MSTSRSGRILEFFIQLPFLELNFEIGHKMGQAGILCLLIFSSSYLLVGDRITDFCVNA